MTNPNDPAFVKTAEACDDGFHSAVVRSGLTKREYFAAMAMQGLLRSNYGVIEHAIGASDAMKCADALIKELNK